MIKLSIIIPYYKVLDYFKLLMNSLVPQLNEYTELIIVDDGCNELELDNYKKDNIKVIHLEQNSGGASIPRNKGLELAIGEYITFIDADDLVKDNYIETILNKMDTSNFDYCFFSWESIGKFEYKTIIEDEPPEWNCSVWNCIYKKDVIKDIQFNPNMVIAEDYDFNLRARKGKKENIKEILYIYRSGVENSLTSRGV